MAEVTPTSVRVTADSALSGMQIDAVLFDNDGTLTDSVPVCALATNRALSQWGFPEVSLDDVAEGMRYETIIRMMRHAGTGDVETGRRLADSYYRATATVADGTGLFPGIAGMLHRISELGIPMGVVSNNRSDVVRRVLAVNRIDTYFRLVIGEDNAEETKPGPGGLLQACRMLGVEPPRVCYVGDGPSDAMAARAAGILPIGVLWNSHGSGDVESMGFTFTLERPESLPELLATAVSHGR